MSYESNMKTNKMGRRITEVFTSDLQRSLNYNGKNIRVVKSKDGRFFLFGCDIMECVGYRNKYETIKKNDPIKRIIRVFGSKDSTGYRDYNALTLDEIFNLPKTIRRMNNAEFLAFLKENATNEKLEKLFCTSDSTSVKNVESDIMIKIDGEPIGFLPNIPSYMIEDPFLQAIKFSQERESSSDSSFNLTKRLKEQSEEIQRLESKISTIKDMQEKLIAFSKRGE